MSADATVYQGTDNEFVITIYDDSSESNVKDLTGFTVAWYRVFRNLVPINLLELDETPNDNDSVVAFDSPRSAGDVRITLKGEDVDALYPMKYGHQLKLVDSSNNRQIVTVGYLTVLRAAPA